MASFKKNNFSGILLSNLLLWAVVSALMASCVESFCPTSTTSTKHQRLMPSSFTICGRDATTPVSSTFLAAAGGKKKRRRKRKTSPQEETTTTATPPSPSVDTSASEASMEDATAIEGEDFNVDDIKNVAEFAFGGGDVGTPSPQAVEEPAPVAKAPSFPSVQAEDGSIPLPDIKDTLRRKKMEIANKGGPMEDNMPKKKIDRNDRAALLKLLEQDPYADGDDSFFEEQEYTSISAWLGEGTKPFLGIPTGPLQVGHTIGALVIVLMAFVEYPGFPLTNLPTPLRGALQGGLGTIYGINVLLAVFAVFKASERGQSVPLWVAKTLTVGGLAIDQLTQLPTTEQIEAAKARKGKRALKNRKN